MKLISLNLTNPPACTPETPEKCSNSHPLNSPREPNGVPIARYTPSQAMDYLRKVVDHLPEPWKGCCLHVLNHPSFAAWPAATSNHHAYPGGLAVHTAEVLEFTVHTVEMNPALNKIVLTVAAIYHDFGKIWDYQPNPNYPTAPESKPWTITDHFQLVHHIQRSYQEFIDKAKGTDPNMQMLIGHCILAHHGCPAWGSPVEPKTQEAWALHLADMFSARCMNARPPEKTS